VPEPVQLLDAAAVAAALPMAAAIAVMRQAFAELAAGRAVMPPRQALPLARQGGGVLLVMPAALPERGEVGVKLASLVPGNPVRGLPLIHALMVLIDAGTGRIAALADGAAITALRTGAVSGLATDLLAPRDAAALAVIGSGAQARTQIEAVCAVRAIRSLAIYSRNPVTAAALARAVAARADAPRTIAVAASARQAVAGADIVCTATSTAAALPVLERKDIRPGTHLNVIGGSSIEACEVDPRLLGEALVAVEQRAAAVAECGEIRAALAAGWIAPGDLLELGELLAEPLPGGPAAGRRTTVFRSVGIALADTAAAAAALRNAAARGLGAALHGL
jgi:ornithine cyclodeaminase